MKPLLSELFLPCSGMHSPIRANRYPLTTITGAQRASGQTHSRARSHQGDADLRADRSTAYLVSCIRVRSAHGNSLDHLVGAGEQAIRHDQAERLRGFEIDRQLVLRWTLHRQIGGALTLEDAVDVTGRAPKLIERVRPIGEEAAGAREELEGVNRRQAVLVCERDDQIAINRR